MPFARRLRVLGHRTATWAWSVAVVAGAIAFAVDGVLVWRSHHSVRGALTCALAASALGVALGVAVSPAVTLVVETERALARARCPWNVLAFAPLLAAPFATLAVVGQGWMVSDPARPTHYYELQGVAFMVAAFALGMLARSPGLWARASVVALGAVAFVIDVVTPRGFYRDAHDLLGILALAAAVISIRPRTAHPYALLGLLLAGTLAVTTWLDRMGPGWRANATNYGRYMPRIARFFRLVVDLDHDGYSSIAWGGDCDDLDPRRNPIARENMPGVDANCNGVELPAHPTDANRGLAAPAGAPDSARLERFILVSIDCLRRDAFRPDVMPNLLRFAGRGLVLTRMYAAGARTELSFPLMQRGSDDAPPVASRLAAHGVTSTAVFGMSHPRLVGGAGSGFSSVDKPTTFLRDATDTTDHALADLAAHAGSPHYLWVHYYDAHWPYRPQSRGLPAVPDALEPPAYYRELAGIDRELERLLQGIEAIDGFSRTAIVITGDHGESFGAHDVWFHSTSTHEDLVQVPAVFYAPDLRPGAYDGLASHRDLPATVLGAFGLVSSDANVELFGRSWFRLRTRPAPALHNFVVARGNRALTLYGWAVPQAAIVEGHLKLVKTFEDGLVEAYDLAADPDETSNADPDSAEATRMEGHLELFRDIDRYP